MAVKKDGRVGSIFAVILILMIVVIGIWFLVNTNQSTVFMTGMTA